MPEPRIPLTLNLVYAVSDETAAYVGVYTTRVKANQKAASYTDWPGVVEDWDLHQAAMRNYCEGVMVRQNLTLDDE